MAATASEETNLSTSSVPNTAGPGDVFPHKIDRFLDVITYSPGGEYVFVGASSLNTTLWRGSALLFHNSYCCTTGCLKPTTADCLSGIVVETGVCSAVFVDNTKLIFGCDSGEIRFNDVKDNPSGGDALKVQLHSRDFTNEHSSSVSDLDVLEKGHNAVSCSQDCSIKVWNVETLRSEHTYSPAHTNAITGVKRQPNSSYTFASTSLDGTALFWDIRQSKPASCLRTTPGVGLTALTWCNAETVVLGSVSGNISTLDMRNLSECGGSLKSISRPVHRLESCPQDPCVIAVCQDSSTFTVIRCENTGIQTLYQDDRHADFVRSASWHPLKKSVLVCSWDSTISSHELPSTHVNGFDKHTAM